MGTTYTRYAGMGEVLQDVQRVATAAVRPLLRKARLSNPETCSMVLVVE